MFQEEIHQEMVLGTLLMLHSSGGLWGGAIGTAAPKNFRFAKCDKYALVWFTGSTNRLRESKLTGERLLFLKLWRTAKRQGNNFQWRTGIALAYRQGRRSFFLFWSTSSKIDENVLGIQFFKVTSFKLHKIGDVYPVLQKGVFRRSRAGVSKLRSAKTHLSTQKSREI